MLEKKKLYYIVYTLLISYLPIANLIISHQKKTTLIALSLIIYYVIFYKILFNEKYVKSFYKTINLPGKFWIFVLFFLTYIFQNFFLNFEQITWDVPSYLVASLDVAQGNLPFKTQWESKGPLLMYVYHILSEVSQQNYVYFKIINDTFIFLAAIIIFSVFNRYYKKPNTGVLASLIFILTTSHEWFVSEFSEIYCIPILGLAYSIYKKKEKKLYGFLYIGILISVATLINQGTLIFTIPYLIMLYYDHLKNKEYKFLYYFIAGLIIPQSLFIVLYYSNDLLDIYFANYITIPLAYSGSSAASFYELSVVLRRFFQYNQFLFYLIISLAFFIFLNIIFTLKQKNFKLLLNIEFLNFLFGVFFYFIAGHNYAHHLFYIIYFGCFLLVFITKEQEKIIYTFAIIAFITLSTNIFPKSVENLTNLEAIYEDYPLRQLSEIIEENFSDNIDILALDYVLVLYYLDQTNESYIVHPGNHYEDYIVETLIKFDKIQTNNFSHVSFLIEQEPDVILCNPTDIIFGKAVNRDFYNCSIDDYKKNYTKIDTNFVKNNPALSLYKNPYQSINLYFKDR